MSNIYLINIIFTASKINDLLMIRSFFSLLFMLLCGVAGHAQKSTKDTVQQITLDTLTVTAHGGPLVYRGSTAKQWEIQHTRIALSFNWKEKTADAREWIKLHPYRYATDTLVMDAQDMRIDSIELVNKKGNIPLKYTYDKDHVKISFGCMYKPSDSIELYLKYTAMPYNDMKGGSTAITDDRGLYFINTDYSTPHKPAEIWTQGETESNSHWMITIDKPNTRFTTQVELTVPDSFVTLGNGAMVRQVKGKGMHTDTWKMDMPIQAYAVMFAIGKYSIIKDHWKNKEVSYYVEPEYAQYAAKMFNNTAEMMGYFSERTGVPYPWNKYSQVVARDYVSGAMENTSASLFGEFMNQNAREIADKNSEDIVSHELFHQWFGDYVTAESWSNLTVNESFANYGEQLWRAHKYGKASADELAYNDLQGYIGYSQINDPQLVRFHYDSREEMFDPISYNKGGAILHYLNNLVGDAAFDKAMNIYLTKNALHSAEAHNWRMAVEEATGQDWNWFFNEWYYHAGHPVIKVTYNYDDDAKTLGISVIQKKQADSPFLYQLPIKTAILYGNSREMVDWNITKRRDTFTYAYKDGKRPVVIPDYDHVLPAEIKDNKKPEQYMVQFMNCDDYVNKRLAVSAAGKLLSDSVSQLIIDRGLNDGLASIRKLTLSQLKNASSETYHKRWTAKIRNIAITDSSKIVRADALGVLGAWKVKSAEEDMLRALYDSSYILAGNALEAINKLDKDTAYILSRQLMLTNPKSTLDYVIWNVIGNKGADEDIALYEAHAPYVQGGKKFNFAASMSSYLKNVKSEESFSRCVAVYTDLIASDNLKGYRAALGGILFQVATEEKDSAKSDKKDEAAIAKRRLAIVKTALEKIVAAEKDAETLKDYKSKMKDI